MPNFETPNFKPRDTKEENLKARDHWLEKAVSLELEGKHGLAEKSFAKAHDHERAALDY